MIIGVDTKEIHKAMAVSGKGITALANETGLSVSTVNRILESGTGQHAKVLAIVYALGLDQDEVTYPIH